MSFSHGGLLSPQRRQQLEAITSDWRLTPATLAHKISRGSWIPAKHLLYISSRVAKGIAKGNARIIISAPPRHGKSELTSVYTPTWTLERYPQKKIILAGYGADLTEGFSRRVRDYFLDDSNKGLLTTTIKRDAQKVDAFLTDAGGGMYAVGLGGAITGRGAHVLLIDDYIKEIKEALSPAYREYVWNWFVTTAFTRLEPDGSCIIIATRWHSDDLIGRILRNFPGQWEYIEIPAEAGEDDLIGRQPGEALFPERYPKEKLQELKETLGTIFYQALYQQVPADETRKITNSEWFKIISMPPTHELRQYRWARMWDLAATKDGGDYTVGTLVGWNRLTNHCLIANVVRRQLSPQEVEKLVQTIAIQDGIETKVLIEQEPGSAGKSLVNHYQVNILPEYTVVPIPAVTNKVVRAQPFIAAAEAGHVSLLEGSWNDAFSKEFDSFPGGANDDQIDTASAGYVHLSGKKVFSAAWGRTKTEVNKSTANSKNLQQAQLSVSPIRTRGATFGRRY